MAKEIYLNGLTADQLSEMIRESLRDELQQLRPLRQKSDTKYLTRQERARRLRISLVTLTDWVNRGKICAHKIGGVYSSARAMSSQLSIKSFPLKDNQ